MSEVKRWWSRNFDFHHKTPHCEGQCTEVVAASDYDRDVAALKAERTDLLAKNKDLQELARVAMVVKAKLAATVERVKALPVHYAHGNPVVTKAALDLALAQPVKREERRKGEECLDSTKTTFHHESPQGYCTFGPDRRRAGSGE
jgi:hypothetical protein